MTAVVTLEPYELAVAAFVGQQRYEGARHLPDRNGPPAADPEGQHIAAAGAEMAFAKWSGRYYPCTFNTFKRLPDVGRFEVRWSRSPGARLRVSRHDAPSSPYVLVVGEPPTYTLCGWLWGAEAQQEAYLALRPGWRPCYLVPQADLRPLDDLQILEPLLAGEAVA